MGPDDGRLSLPLRSRRRATPGAGWPPAAMGQAGPALVVTMASPVTPCGDSPHPTVLDPWVPTDHPAARGGDVGGPDDVTVAAETAERTAKAPPPRLGDPLATERAGRGGPPLVDLNHMNARQLGLVVQRPDEMGAPPVAKAQVLAPAGVLPADALGSPTRKVPLCGRSPRRPPPWRPRAAPGGCAAYGGPRPGAGSCAACASASTPAGPGWGPCDPSSLPGPWCREVQVALGSHRPPRNEKGLGSRHHGEGMDDARVHAGDDPGSRS